MVQMIDTKNLGWINNLPCDVIVRIVDLVELQTQASRMAMVTFRLRPNMSEGQRELVEARMSRILLKTQ